MHLSSSSRLLSIFNTNLLFCPMSKLSAMDWFALWTTTSHDPCTLPPNSNIQKKSDRWPLNLLGLSSSSPMLQSLAPPNSITNKMTANLWAMVLASPLKAIVPSASSQWNQERRSWFGARLLAGRTSTRSVSISGRAASMVLVWLVFTVAPSGRKMAPRKEVSRTWHPLLRTLALTEILVIIRCIMMKPRRHDPFTKPHMEMNPSPETIYLNRQWEGRFGMSTFVVSSRSWIWSSLAPACWVLGSCCNLISILASR